MIPALPDGLVQVPIAHRALHDVDWGRPENSRAAIRAAIDAGYPVEIDLQASADGQAMVFHDYGLERLTPETGPVQLRRADDLADIPLLGGDGEGIPTLAEILKLVAGRVPLLVEVKDQDGAMGPNIGRLEEATVAALRGYAGPVALMSFNPHSVAAMARFAPEIPRGLTTSGYDPTEWPLSGAVCDHLRGIPDFDRVGASFISHDCTDLDRPRVQVLRQQGVPILCYTVKSQAEEDAARPFCDNITFEGYAAAIPT